MARPYFLARGVLAAVGALILLRLHPSDVLAVCAWSAIALAVGSELLASAVYLHRRRAPRPPR